MPEFKQILFPLDFTEGHTKLLPLVRMMAQKHGAQVHVLHVVEDLAHYSSVYVPHADISDMMTDVIHAAEKRMSAFCQEDLPDLNPRTAVAVGDPAQETLKYVDNNDIDLVIMGTHGRKGLEHVIFGSVAESVLRNCPVPVMVMNPMATEA